MLKCLTCVALIYFPFFLFAQDERINSVNSEMFFSKNYQNESNFCFTLAFSKKQHVFAIGPRFTLSEKSNSEIGLNSAYRFFPNKKSPRFDLFFQYQLEVIKQRLYYASVNKGIALSNTIGYGFNIRISPALYITHGIGAGFQKSWFKGHENIADPSLLLNIGLGYRISKRQKEQAE